MAEIDSEYFIVVVLWVASFAILLARAWRGASPVVGLALTYWFSLATIHLLGGLVQMLPRHVGPEPSNTIAGFCLTGYALAGLLIGNGLLAPWLFRRLQHEKRHRRASPPTQRLAPQYVLIGLLVYFLAARLLRFIPSLSAVLSGGLPLAVGGLCLLWWHFWTTDQPQKAWCVVAAASIVPVLTVLLIGYLGYGVFALATVGCFVAVYYRPRTVILVIGLCAAIAGISLFSVYAKARTEIRRAVWGEKSFSERLGVAYNSLEKGWSWFDASNESHLTPIEERLNQNYLVGVAYRNLNEQIVEFARGETCIQALLALVPRMVWPDKPIWAGSGTLVTRFTGIPFQVETSVGIGHVMELYVNFGESGLFLGYIILGFSIGLVDMMAGRHLHAGEMKAFILWFVPGQAMLQVEGNFAEMTAAAAGYAILCAIVNRFTSSQPLPRPSQPTGTRGPRWPRPSVPLSPESLSSPSQVNLTGL